MLKSITLIVIVLLSFHLAYAQTIPITISDSMKDIVFDGKWSFAKEWKESSLDTIETNSGSIYIRTSHHENYIYVMIDAVGITHFSKNSDRATICIDGKDDKSPVADSDDYCFVVTLGDKNPFVLQGGSDLGFNSNFKMISSLRDAIGIGGISDENDRYSPIPHQSYEFRIPTDLVGRSDRYGFYVSVYDSVSNKIYSWPSVSESSPLKIPSPKIWGELISPDKSLPEFPYPLFTLILSLAVVFYLTRLDKNKF